MVSALKIIQAASEELRLDILPRSLRNAFRECAKLSFLPCETWYLAGGTALALQVGHRKSFDLDFFTPQKLFHEQILERSLLATDKWITTLREAGTLYGIFMDAKMSFIAYPFFQPSRERIRSGDICLLKPHDIASMKIIAISQRGRKRDFIDLYWYCVNREPLQNVIKRAIQGYPGQEHNIQHILKSIVYFVDADEDPMPELFFDANWKTIKAYFKKEVPRIAKELLHLKT